MIKAIIDFSLRNRVVVLLLSLLVVALGIQALSRTALDALPDLSDVQVIIKTEYPGQPPQRVEDQVTYPLASSLLATPGATAVRAFSMFGESYIYVIFADGTDLYWARSRVLERLSASASKLPAGSSTALGPDASGVGWVFQYALVDKLGKQSNERLRSLQDFYLKQELQSVPGVAEVASIGGAGLQFQVDVDPTRLAAAELGMEDIANAIRAANQSAGGGAFELGRAQFVVRSNGQLKELADFEHIVVGKSASGTPLLLRQFARVSTAPQNRFGVSDLNGQGEAVGGIVVMRHGENALKTIKAVKARLAELKRGLPQGVELVTTYDRSGLIERAVATLRDKLLEESLVVALVCLAFLFHLRASLVAIVTLPVGILAAVWVMRLQGVSANIMSLGGIAIAISAMIDAAVVMIETMHRKLELAQERDGQLADHWQLARESAQEVGPSLFFSLLVITLSFLPVFALTGQEGRLFSPLAYTKTYAMAAAAILAITLTPVLMGYAIRGRVRREMDNPLNRWLSRAYRPLLAGVLARPRLTLGVAGLALASALLPYARLGSEFMPALDEGDLLYMPTTLPGVAVDEAQNILQLTNRLIMQLPEVAQVYGKAGRADSATDPAPISMIESTIVLKPKAQWPAGESMQDVIAKLDQTVKLAGLTNSWGYPIRTRIDMLSTGVKTSLGIKISGPDGRRIEQLGSQVERVLRDVPGIRSVFAERLNAGRYLDIDIRRDVAARLGVRIEDIQLLVDSAIGGASVGNVLQGRERYPIVLRYPRAARSDLEAIGNIRVKGVTGQSYALRQLADIHFSDGPTELKSENARPVGYVFIDMDSADAGRVYAASKAAIADAGIAAEGYSLSWVGQYLQYEDSKPHLTSMILLALGLIVLLLYLHFRSGKRVAMVLLCLPFGLVGGVWLLWLLGYQLSVAVIVGLIALSGVAAEFGVVMLLYLDQAVAQQQARGGPLRLDAALTEGALLRLRPKMMTVAVILAGLLPVMFSDGTGADVMKRIAAPLVGGMVTAPLFSLLVMPALYRLFLQPSAQREPAGAAEGEPTGVPL